MEGSSSLPSSSGSDGRAVALNSVVSLPGLPRSWLMLLFGFALVIRLAHVLAMTGSPYFANPVIDAAEYDAIGWSLAQGRGYPERVFWHPPGYPLFLGAVWWLLGGSYLAPRLVQALLGALSVVLVAWIGGRRFGPRVGLAAGLGAAVYGMLIYFDGELLAPTLTIFLVLVTVACALRALDSQRWWWWAAAGVCGGLAGIVTATVLVVPLAIAWVARRKAIAVVLGTALVLAPVTLANCIRGHQLVLVSSNGGVNLWVGNNPNYQSMVEIRPDLEWRRLVDEPRRAGVHGEAAASRYFVGKVWAWAKTDPWAFLRLQAHKLRLLLSGNEIYRNHAIYPARQDSPLLAALLWKVPGLAFPFGVLIPFATLGLWVGMRRAPLLGVITLGLAVMVQVFFVTARYRVVLVPFLLVFAAEGGRWLVRVASRQQRIVAGLAMLALLLLANLGQGPMDHRMNPDAEYSLAVRLGERGHMKEAQALFESVVAARPSYVEAWLNLAVCYDQAGRANDAEAAVRRALLLDKEAVRILQRFMGQGKPEAAQKLLEHVRAVVAGQQ